MVFYESTSFGMRVAVFEFVSLNKYSNIKFRLIPMCHIGSESYYAKVEELLHQSNLILYEGNKYRTWKFPINNFKITAEKLGLKTQSSALKMAQFGEKIIHADLDEETGPLEWKKLSLWDKIKYNLIIPIWIYFQDRYITRKKLAKYYMKSSTDQDLVFGNFLDEKGTISNYTGNSREQIVFKKIKEFFNQRMEENIHISIIYGAGHMPAISRFLMDELNYQNVGGFFLEVFKS